MEKMILLQQAQNSSKINKSHPLYYEPVEELLKLNFHCIKSKLIEYYYEKHFDKLSVTIA